MDQFVNIIRGFGAAKVAGLAGILIAVIGFLAFFVNMANTPELSLLYSHLEQNEAARVVDKLKTSGIPYEVSADGSQILAPTDKLAELRMQFSLDNIVTGGSIGYEIFDRSDVLGTSSAMLNINHLRALEGELGKSVKAIGSVLSARIHLVIPKRELFSKDKLSPSASVILKMKSGQRLSSNQVQAVQSLITSAVPNMTNDRISIIDDRGTLLARGRDSEGVVDTFSTQTSQREEYEEKLARQIELLLEKSIGAEHIRVEVSSEMNFDRTTTQSVDFDPDGQVAKSTDVTEEGVNADESNGSADAVSIQNAIPNEENKNGGGQKTSSKSKNSSKKTEEVTAFEISNKTTTTVHETGVVKRLSIAVIVDGTYTKDASGTLSYAPRTAEELKQLTEIIETASGYKKERGDTVKVINLKFKTLEEMQKIEEVEFWKVWIHSLDFKRIVELFIIGIFSLIIIITFIRPMMYRLLSVVAPKMINPENRLKAAGQQHVLVQQSQSSQPQQVIAQQRGQDAHIQNSHMQTKMNKQQEYEKGSDININNIDGLVKISAIKQVSEVVKANPDETLSLLRSWLYEGD